MKILIDGRVLKYKYKTGVQRYAINIVDSFRKLNINFDIATPKSSNRYFQHLWEHICLPQKAKIYDILFCPGNVAPLYKPKNLKIVVTLHSLAFKNVPTAYNIFFRTYYHYAMSKILKICNKVITVSESEKNIIISAYPKLKDKVVAVQNGIDEIFKVKEPKYEKENYILCVGSLNPLKNLNRVIEAFFKIEHKINHKLIIIGSKPPIFSNTKTKFHERIIFKNQILDDKNLLNYYMNAALFVFPSLYEASPLPPLEAMASGCPVLASDITAVRERCGDAALYCNPEDTDDITNKILTIITNKSLTKELIKKGLVQVKNFSWEKTARETLAIFKEVYE